MGELQKRVDGLQKQLRKAGDHLKDLATENGTLGEQVDKLTEQEAQLQTQNQQLTKEIDELKTNENSLELKTWKSTTTKLLSKAGVSTDKLTDTPGIIDALEASFSALSTTTTTTSDNGDDTSIRKQLADAKQRIKCFEDNEAAFAAMLESKDLANSLKTDNISDKLQPGVKNLLYVLQTHVQKAEKVQSKLNGVEAELDEITEAREELGRDYDLLVERIGTMRGALTAKMNSESDEVKRLRKQLADTQSATNETDLLRDELDQTKRALWESQEEANHVQAEYNETAEKSTRQVSELKAKLQTTEEHLETYTSQNATLEDQIEKLQSDLNEALNSESQWVGERDVHLITIQNLQSALENLQESKDTEVDVVVEKLREELHTSLEKERSTISRAESAEGKLRKIELSGATAEQWQQKANNQQGEVERLRHEVSTLKDHLNESMRRLREESNDFNLDKRVITNLIVSFLALAYGDSKRYEVLQLMSSMLQFTEEQQEKVGLIRKAGRWGLPRLSKAQSSSSSPSSPSTPATNTFHDRPPQIETKDSFSDQWISFLLRESSKTRNSNNADAATT